jgi:hypothetical protein
MPDQTVPTTRSTEQGAKTDALDSSTIALAFVSHTIKLHDTADGFDFERFMLKEVFPAVDTRDAGFGNDESHVTPDQHFLLGGRSFNEYVWMIRLEYFIHHTPLPTWLGRRASVSYARVKDRIEQFGTRTATELLFDVKEWHQRLGFE